MPGTTEASPAASDARSASAVASNGSDGRDDDTHGTGKVHVVDGRAETSHPHSNVSSPPRAADDGTRDEPADESSGSAAQAQPGKPPRPSATDAQRKTKKVGGSKRRDVAGTTTRRPLFAPRPGAGPLAATTRVPSAAAEEAGLVQPTPQPTPAENSRLPVLAGDDTELVTAPTTHSPADNGSPPKATGGDLGSPVPRAVLIADQQAWRRRQRGPGGAASMSRSPYAAASTPLGVRAPAALRTIDELHHGSPHDQLRPVPDAHHALTPEPHRNWEPVSDVTMERRRQKGARNDAPSVRQPTRLRQQDHHVKEYYEYRQNDLAPLVTPTLAAAAVLRLQNVREDTDRKRVRRLQPVVQRPPEQRTLAPGPSLSMQPTEEACVSNVSTKSTTGPQYVPPNKRKLAPMQSMPRDVGGKAMFDASRATRRSNARSLARALLGPTAETHASPEKRTDGASPQALDAAPSPTKLSTSTVALSPNRRSGRTKTVAQRAAGDSSPSPKPKRKKEVERDAVEELVRSIPMAIRRHMSNLPESESVARRRAAEDKRMRRFRSETEARLQQKDKELEAMIRETHQMHVFALQRRLAEEEEAAKKAEQDRRPAAYDFG